MSTRHPSVFLVLLAMLCVSCASSTTDSENLPSPVMDRPSGPAIGCVTLTPGSIKADSARLYGARMGAITEEWFDFGTSPEPGHSVDAKDGIGIAQSLQPATTYYYRYVTKDAHGTCRGVVRSFKTSAN